MFVLDHEVDAELHDAEHAQISALVPLLPTATTLFALSSDTPVRVVLVVGPFPLCKGDQVELAEAQPFEAEVLQRRMVPPDPTMKPDLPSLASVMPVRFAAHPLGFVSSVQLPVVEPK